MATSLLQLKLTLLDVKPAVWRRLYVSSQVSLEQLHEIILVLTGWGGEHPHEFVIGEARYGRPSPREIVPVQNEALYRLHSLPTERNDGFVYVYDFDVHWQIDIRVENVLSRDMGGGAPLVLDGERAFPPEDSGGADAYSSLVEASPGPDRPPSAAIAARLPEGFDPERFDLSEVNERLRTL